MFSDLGRHCQRRQHRPSAVGGGVRPSADWDTLIVWRLDRLGRSLPHLIEIIGDLEARGVGFKSVQENIDTTTPGGRLVFHVFSSLAQFSVISSSSGSAPSPGWPRLESEGASVAGPLP